MWNRRVIITVPNEPNNERNTQKKKHNTHKKRRNYRISSYMRKNASFFLFARKHSFFFNGLNLRLHVCMGLQETFFIRFFFLFSHSVFSPVSINHIHFTVNYWERAIFMTSRQSPCPKCNSINSTFFPPFFCFVFVMLGERASAFPGVAWTRELAVLMSIRSSINMCWQFWWEI